MSEAIPVLSSLTTMRVGGAPRRYMEARDEQSLVDAVTEAWDDGEPWLILGGGSNIIVADAGFDGTVIRVATTGIQELPGDDPDLVRLRVQAGHDWDDLVAYTVDHGLTGVEALSGIPGSCGAAPIQNIGAYGQELSDTLVAVDFVDLETAERVRLSADELRLGYRTSVIKQGRGGLVVAIELELRREPHIRPIAYAQLASALGVEIGQVAPTADVRSAVLALRASKGMLLGDDPDSVSAGSFFTNPIVGERFAASLPADAPRWPMQPDPQDMVVPLDQFDERMLPTAGASGERRVKLSAAWLIERSGIRRGYRLPGSAAAISGKHTLAIVNTGGATAEQVGELARYVQGRVMAEFGVLLRPEPVLIGVYV